MHKDTLIHYMTRCALMGITAVCLQPLSASADDLTQGFRYDNGLADRPVDRRKASEFYKLSAERGDPEAQFYLAMLYHRGDGVAKDDAEAYKWLSLAHAANPQIGGQVLERLDQSLSRTIIAEGKRRAALWSPIVAID